MLLISQAITSDQQRVAAINTVIFVLALGLTVAAKRVRLRTRIALFTWYVVAAYGGTSDPGRTQIRVASLTVAGVIVGLVVASFVWLIGLAITRIKGKQESSSGDPPA